MQLFYSQRIAGDHLFLDEDEARHCMRVLRKTTGDRIEVVDGRGKYYTGVIEEGGKQVKIRIETVEERLPERTHRLHLIVAPTKNMDRMEWMVEKTTEIGVDRISFMQCTHSERGVVRLDRLEKKALAAMKQSGQAVLPQIDALEGFDHWVDHATAGLKLMAHRDEHVQAVAMDGITINANTTVLIGPEGGFSDEEVRKAMDNGFDPVLLGTNRLRTETAAVVACTVFNIKCV